MTPELDGSNNADKAEVAVPLAIGIRAGSFLRRKKEFRCLFKKYAVQVRSLVWAGVWVYRRAMMRKKSWHSIWLGVAFSLGWAVCGFHHAPQTIPPGMPEVFFSPQGGARDVMLELIHSAQHEIILALYYFTDPGMADALVGAAERGVSIYVVLDKSQRKARHSQAAKLLDGGVAVVFDTKHRILHHKFMVVDGHTLITGSQNWTKSAETINAENTLVLADNPTLAARFRAEFFRLHSLATSSVSSNVSPDGGI